MAEIEDLKKAVTDFRDERDWAQFHNPKDMAISLALEAAEVLEHFQWKNNDEMKAHVAENKEELSEELADVLYWILLMCNDLEIDISDAFINKLVKNAKKYPISKAKGNHKKYTELKK